MLYSQVFLFQIGIMVLRVISNKVMKSAAAFLLLAGCQANETSVNGNEALRVSMPESQISTPEHHAAIINFVTQGDTALQVGDGTNLRKAAQSLQAMGAVPISGTDDLAKNWLVTAQTISADHGEIVPPYRGRIKGPAYRKQVLPAGSKDVIEDVYYAAEAAEMTLKSLEKTELYWEIIEADSDAPPVCAGQTLTTPQSCRFTPLWTAKYNILISNISDQDTTYLFITN